MTFLTARTTKAYWASPEARERQRQMMRDYLAARGDVGRKPIGHCDDGAVIVPLTCGKVTVIDAADVERVCRFSWTYKAGYAHRRPAGQKQLPLHRFIHGYYGPLQIDHIDGDGLNNRRNNLRIATKKQNAANSRPRGGRQFKGVHFRHGWWFALIKVEGRVYRQGRLGSEEEAARAFDAMARHHHGEFAWLNFPERGPATTP